MVKLTEEIVKEIRYGMYKDMSSGELMKLLNVSISIIANVRNGNTWSDI